MIAHELAHIKNRDTLTMTITATLAGAISMLAQFGMFFGGNREQQRLRHHRHARHGDPGADRRHAGADGDQPHARIRRRPAGRADRRQSERARLGAGEDLQRGAADRESDARSRTRRPRISSSSIRSPAAWLGQPVRHPSCDRRTASRRCSSSRARWAMAATAAAAPRRRRQPAGRRPWNACGGGPWGDAQKRASRSATAPVAVRGARARDAEIMPHERMTLRAQCRRPARPRRAPHRRRHPRRRAAAAAAHWTSSSTAPARIPDLRRSPTATARWRGMLIATVLRRLGTLRHLLGRFLERGMPADAPRVETALLIGAAQILWLDVPDHAAVDLSVASCSADRRAARYAGLVNAVLRRVAQNGCAALARHRPLALDTPDWLLARWQRTYGAGLGARHRRRQRPASPRSTSPSKADPAHWAERARRARAADRLRARDRAWAGVEAAWLSPKAPGGCRTPPRRCRRGSSATCAASGRRSLRRARRQDRAARRAPARR